MPEVCRRCDAFSNRDRGPSAWLGHIDQLYTLQQGGYPFQADELSLEVWHDLGVYRTHIESMRVNL